jgi:hypothetical protein
MNKKPSISLSAPKMLIRPVTSILEVSRKEKHNAWTFVINKEKNKPTKQEVDVESSLREWVQNESNYMACGSRNDVSEFISIPLMKGKSSPCHFNFKYQCGMKHTNKRYTS